MRHVFRMAFPMVIGIGAIISFSIADTYFIGQLGVNELAAISFTMPVTTLFFNVVFGMAIAMSAVVSRKIGAGLWDDVRIVATIGIAISFLLSVVLAMAGYALIDPIFSGLGAGEDILPHIHKYMPIWFAGSVFLAIPVVANSAIRGTGDAFWPAAVMVFIAVLNVVLDPILIFGFYGVPAMGIKGAAIASSIAYIFGAIAALSILAFREKLFSLRDAWKKSAWKLASKPLLVIAIPVSLANMIAPLLTYGYTAILAGISTAAVAGYGIASRLEAFALIPVMALAGGMAPLVGQNYGAGLGDRVAEALRKSLVFAVLYGMICFAVFFAVADTIVQEFTQSTRIRAFASSYLVLVSMSYVGVNMFAVVTSMMNATGHPKRSLALNIGKSFVVALPLAYVLSSFYGENGFLWSVIATNIVGGVIVFMNLKRIRCA